MLWILSICKWSVHAIFLLFREWIYLGAIIHCACMCARVDICVRLCSLSLFPTLLVHPPPTPISTPVRLCPVCCPLKSPFILPFTWFGQPMTGRRSIRLTLHYVWTCSECPGSITARNYSFFFLFTYGLEYFSEKNEDKEEYQEMIFCHFFLFQEVSYRWSTFCMHVTNFSLMLKL